ncbi:similar to Saccharomyces cerevisiae YDR273W DON1 Meiosis-specific component of the spindle pole body [Maudiozyma saulgeensis]|uniref:Similar to Saccharomyces cerevisiae YDR273W DON1 Meiosis-specific component of the spindle pole body n=1 Tax=Maudiozyma saulgeensis TaxID=1789683 RepID=A0A1X7QX11_9SACH|nr:similar to Saccharomyces cerevisiae YDR273W DON1 Meiosis-specific component of the spindle pole body [Kazachstania saulgeensis]
MSEEKKDLQNKLATDGEDTVENVDTVDIEPEVDTSKVEDTKTEKVDDVNVEDDASVGEGGIVLMDEDPEETTEDKNVETSSNDMKVVDPKPVSLEELETEGSSAPEIVKDTTTRDTNDNEDYVPPLPTRQKATVKENKPKENPLLKQLKDAFPTIEEKYIKAVVIASNGSMDPAFNALLYLSDPEASTDIALPSKQPSPTLDLPSRKKLTQLEQDELLAKQLNDQYNKNYQKHSQHRKGSTNTTTSRSGRGDDTMNNMDEPIPFDSVNGRDRQLHEERLSERRRRLRENGEFNPDTYRDDDSWGQFVEKDLPEMTARANKSLQDTASKVGNWFNRNFGAETQQSGGNNNNNNFAYSDTQMREQEEAFRYYESQRNTQTNGNMSSTRTNESQAERPRFNSFGARIGEDSLENHGISLNNDEFSDDEDVPPQLPSRERSKDGNTNINTDEKTTNIEADPDASMVTNDSQRVVSQTTYIDTPDKTPKKKWQPVPPEPMDATPTKINATSNKVTDSDTDDFMINSDDE